MDTIAAITTAMGAAGVGIIRISGSEAAEVADRVFKSKKGTKIKNTETHRITYGWIVDKSAEYVDEALVLNMWEPHSFTGENVVEIQCHGGMVVLRKVLELVLGAGSRLALPGEFSKRAYLNGKLDITQAEAIMDMVNAKTEVAVKAAANNLQGSISQKVREARSDILLIIAYLEADIDFPEEDIERLPAPELALRISLIEKGLQEMLKTYQSGRIVRDGLKTVLIGKPNVGKSSLLNALLKEKRAIVTDVPGTTRDLIEQYYNLRGIPLILIDTAGLRKTEDLVEKLGVERTKETISEADLILYLLDVTKGATNEDIETVKQLPVENTIVLVNKIDLLTKNISEEELKDKLGQYKALFISAKESVGLDELEAGIYQMVFEQGLEISDKPYLSNARQKEAIERAYLFIKTAAEGAGQEMPSDFISIDLRSAWETLGEVTGETLGEDIIDQIFSKFCLGK